VVQLGSGEYTYEVSGDEWGELPGRFFRAACTFCWVAKKEVAASGVIKCVGDGRAAVDIAILQSPDLILMDLSLPKMDGWEAARMIKGQPATSQIPIIALTAHVMSDDRRRAMEAGCDDYDTKPIRLPRLLSKIEARLESSDSLGLCPA